MKKYKFCDDCQTKIIKRINTLIRIQDRRNDSNRAHILTQLRVMIDDGIYVDGKDEPRVKRKKGGSMKKTLLVVIMLVLLLPGVVRADRVEELSQQFDNMQRKKLNIQRQVVDLQQQIEQINEDMLRLQGRHAERELVVVEEKKAAERAAKIAEELEVEKATENE